jgi:hypothetical protein
VLAEIPREAFTVEAWVRPEGGQNNPAIIAGNNPLLGFSEVLGVWLTPFLLGLNIGSNKGERVRTGKPGRVGQEGGGEGPLFICKAAFLAPSRRQ